MLGRHSTIDMQKRDLRLAASQHNSLDVGNMQKREGVKPQCRNTEGAEHKTTRLVAASTREHMQNKRNRRQPENTLHVRLESCGR